jgi:hypothetical protein
MSLADTNHDRRRLSLVAILWVELADSTSPTLHLTSIGLMTASYECESWGSLNERLRSLESEGALCITCVRMLKVHVPFKRTEM